MIIWYISFKQIIVIITWLINIYNIYVKNWHHNAAQNSELVQRTSKHSKTCWHSKIKIPKKYVQNQTKNINTRQPLLFAIHKLGRNLSRKSKRKN